MTDGRVRRALARYADDFARAAAEADDVEEIDAATALVALARGESVPRDVARRLRERAR